MKNTELTARVYFNLPFIVHPLEKPEQEPKVGTGAEATEEPCFQDSLTQDHVLRGWHRPQWAELPHVYY